MNTSALRARLLTVALAITVVGALMAPAAAVPPATPPPACPEALPIDQVTDGLIAEGWTVSEGTDPETFSAEVLGVMPDGIGPGRDLILIEASSPAITEAGGIWYGMSGSPVYYDGKLLGVLAYGLSWGPSPIAGLTAAEDIMNVLDYPVAPSQAASTSRDAEQITLSRSMSRRVANETGTTAAESDSMVQLKAPLSVSGLSPRALARLKRTIRREHLPFVAHAGASASAPTAGLLGTPPYAGQNFAAALSYGDVTLAGIGTMSVVCADKGVAFGHPFFSWPAGQTLLGASNADALTVVPDSVGGSYKLATVEDGVGIVDQDRFAGIRALFGVDPGTIPITSTITAPDWGRSRDGQTDAISSEWAAYVGFSHALSNIDFTFDQISPGSSAVSLTVKGLRENGAPFVLARNNMFASEYDVSYESVAEMDYILYSLFTNTFEDITFTEIDYDATVQRAVDMYVLDDLRISRNGGAYRSVNELRVRPGDRLSVKVVLDHVEEAANTVHTFGFRIPVDARRSGSINITGGGRSSYYDGEECFYDDSCDNAGAESFTQLLAKLQNGAPNEQLSARLRLGRRVVAERIRMLGQVVRGSDSIYLNVDGSYGGSEPAKS